MKNIFNIIGVDPGNNLGISVISVDVVDLDIVEVSSFTYTLNRYVHDDSTNVLLDRCLKLNQIITGVIEEYDPLIVGVEAAFMNSRFPKSVMQLSQYVGTVEMAIRNSNPWCKIFKYPPKYIKSQVGAGGSADKDMMKSNLQSIESISSLINIDNLTEHSIDSLSIAYVAYEDIKQHPYYLYILP